MVKCEECKYLKEGVCTLYDGSQTIKNQWGGCWFGTPEERGADKQKITCLNCKHLMFSDMYGECNKQLRIVNPGDTCEFAEPKERGGEK